MMTEGIFLFNDETSYLKMYEITNFALGSGPNGMRVSIDWNGSAREVPLSDIKISKENFYVCDATCPILEEEKSALNKGNFKGILKEPGCHNTGRKYQVHVDCAKGYLYVIKEI